jgi:hypothetical protein
MSCRDGRVPGYRSPPLFVRSHRRRKRTPPLKAIPPWMEAMRGTGMCCALIVEKDRIPVRRARNRKRRVSSRAFF